LNRLEGLLANLEGEINLRPRTRLAGNQQHDGRYREISGRDENGCPYRSGGSVQG
jgi:hypothetical protein